MHVGICEEFEREREKRERGERIEKRERERERKRERGEREREILCCKLNSCYLRARFIVSEELGNLSRVISLASYLKHL